MYLKENLYWLRKSKGLTQSEVSTGCGIGRTSYANYEDGKTEPDASKIIDICRFFGISIDEFLTKDLQTVHLNENNGEKKILKNVHPIVHGNVHPNRQNEGNLEMQEQTDLLILKQLNYLSEKIDKMDKKLERMGD